MRDFLSRFHNPHNRSLALKISILSNALVSLFIFFLGFFELDLVDFDSVFRMREIRVDGKSVGVGDVFGFGMFG
jgi:hypothetical protein